MQFFELPVEGDNRLWKKFRSVLLFIHFTDADILVMASGRLINTQAWRLSNRCTHSYTYKAIPLTVLNLHILIQAVTLTMTMFGAYLTLT